MNWPKQLPTFEAAEFRDACFAMWDWCDKKREELGDEFSYDLAIPSFFNSLYPSIGDHPDPKYLSACMRLMEFRRIVHERRQEMPDLYKHNGPEKETEVNWALVEAFGVVPFRPDGHIDLDDLLIEARLRDGQIDSLEKLFGEVDGHPS